MVRGRQTVFPSRGGEAWREWPGHSDPATMLRHYVRLTMAARAKAVAGLDEVTRAALERAEEKVLEDAGRSSTTSSRSPAGADSLFGGPRLAIGPALEKAGSTQGRPDLFESYLLGS